MYYLAETWVEMDPLLKRTAVHGVIGPVQWRVRLTDVAKPQLRMYTDRSPCVHMTYSLTLVLHIRAGSSGE